MKERVFYADLIRACAILMVVACHVYAPVCADMNQYSTTAWWMFNLLNALTRSCVPLFFMISGKFLLGSTREESYGCFLLRRFPRLLVPFFIWSMIYAYDEARLHGVPFHFTVSAHQFLREPTEYHLWFMYAILELYLLAPFLRRFVQSAKIREAEWLLVLWMGYLILKFFYPRYVGLGPSVSLLCYGGYFLLGYELDRTENPRTAQMVLGSVAIGCVNAIATYHRMRQNNGYIDESFYNYSAPLVAIQAGLAFLIFKNWAKSRYFSTGRAWRNVVTTISRESFHVYLIHVLFILAFANGEFGLRLTVNSGGTPFIGVPVIFFLMLASSLTLSFLLRKIPIVSKVLLLPS